MNAAAGDHTFADQLNTTRDTTRKYEDIATAEYNGYSFSGVFDFVGVVYSNQSNVNNINQTEDPSVLFYAPTRGADIEDEDDVENSNTTLAGIEYHVTPRGAGDQDIFADEEASREFKVTEAEGWHTHPNPEVDLTGLHVWAHLHNDDGVFAKQHPVIRDRLSD